MGTTHDRATGTYDRAFAIGICLNVAFVVIEAVYGIKAHSLALVADAGHNLSDVLGLVLAWGASVLARRRPTPRRTYGMRRSSVLAALGNAVLLLIAIGAIAWEAIRRFAQPMPVAASTVMAVAGVGIVINSVTALLFWAGRKGDLNIQGAFLHMAADAGVSAGVVAGGLALRATGWIWLDPAISLAIVGGIFVGTWGLLKDSVNLAMDAVPDGIDEAAVRSYLASLPGVSDVPDLHIWGMSTTEVALTAHLVKPGVQDEDGLIARTYRDLHQRFGVDHATLQVERAQGGPPCVLAPAHVI
jgi:cobalt-zinc-cadmium efflux system protein